MTVIWGWVCESKATLRAIHMRLIILLKCWETLPTSALADLPLS